MNEFLAIFTSWQFIVLCISIAAVTFLVRTTVEYFILNNPKMPGNSKSKFWREFALVILPVILGCLFPLIGKHFTYPAGIIDNTSKFMFSSGAGLLSPTLYRVIKALMWKNVSESAPQVVQDFPIVQTIKDKLDDSGTETSDDSNPSEPKV